MVITNGAKARLFMNFRVAVNDLKAVSFSLRGSSLEHLLGIGHSARQVAHAYSICSTTL